jgi:DNA-binding protein HU-beta
MDDIKEPIDEVDASGDDKAAEAGKSDKVFNRQKLVAAVTEKTGLPRAKALAAVEAVFDSMSHSLKGGLEVRVLGFGAFSVSERKAGKGRDPRTGTEIDVPQSKSVRFRAGKGLREMVADTPVA